MPKYQGLLGKRSTGCHVAPTLRLAKVREASDRDTVCVFIERFYMELVSQLHSMGETLFSMTENE
jgi:hypothetical protein